jgi:HEXXH motif-containing protein
VLADHHPQAAADVLALMSALTPLSGADGANRSITSRRVFGSIALSLPADDVAMALTLAHEVQHAKLYAVMDLLPLFTDHAQTLYYAPWRPDPRPLANLLQGMYAHLGVAHFWWLHREVPQAAAGVHHAHVEFVRWRNACAQVAQIISARPELTRYGAAFVEGMLRVLHEWRDESVPPAAQAEAARLAGEHWRHWEKRLDNTRAPTETETAEQETSDRA